MTTAVKSDSSHVESLYFAEWLPPSPPRGVFLLLHGMESHVEWFNYLASSLTQRGYAVMAYDRTGWGKSPGTRGHLDTYRHFVEETMLAARLVREKYRVPVHLAGLSWGGMAALYLALRRGWMFDSVALMAPGLVARRDLRWWDKFRVLHAWRHGNLLRTVEPVLRPEQFTSDPKHQSFIKNDKHRVRAITVSFCLETLKMRRFIKETAGRRLTPPLLAVLAERDAIIDNGKTGLLCRRAGAKLEMIRHSRHSIVLDQPALTAEHLANHADAAVETREKRSRRVWVVGGGSVGGAVGALLSFAGIETGLLIKPKYEDTLRQNGMTLTCGSATRTADHKLTIASEPAGLPPDPEMLIIAVKSFDTRALLIELAGHIPPGCVVTTVQNGVGNEDILAKAFSGQAVVASAICAGLEMHRPGVTSLASDRGGLGGAVYQGDASAAMKTWSEIFPLTGMECRWYGGPNAANRLKWSKLMLNTGFNALNSVTGLSSADLLGHEEYGNLAINAIREGFAVMRALSLTPFDLPGYPVATMARLMPLPTSWIRRLMAWQAGRQPEASFSMRQDLLNKRPNTEIDELNGKVAEISHSMGINAEANARLVKMVKEAAIHAS